MMKNTIRAFAGRMARYSRGVFLPFILPLLIAVLSVAVLWQVNPHYVRDKNLKPASIVPAQGGTNKTNTKALVGTNKPAAIKSLNINYNFEYSAGQNPVVLISLPEFLNNTENCKINAVWINPADESALTAENKLNKKIIYTERTFDLSPWLHEGMNTLVLNAQIIPPWTNSLYVSSRLYGLHLGSNLACVAFFLSMAAVLFNIARCCGLDRPTSGILATAMLYLSKWLISFGSLIYTSDVPGHLAYTYYMAKSMWVNPYNYVGHEDFHPFMYYFFIGRIFDLFRHSPIVVVMVLRITSLFLYSIFILYGLRTLALAIKNKGVVFYMSAFLIAFWPVGILKATNINNDVVVYTLWSIGFYYLVCWYTANDTGAFRKAIITTGILFMMKSNAWVLLGIGGIFTLYGLYTSRLKWRDLFHHNTLFAIGILTSGIILNFSRIIYAYVAYNFNGAPNYFGYPREDFYSLNYLVHFDPLSFLRYPFVTYVSEPGFLNFFFKSALYTETRGWGGRQGGLFLQLPYAMNALLLGLVVTSVFAICWSIRKKNQSLDSLFPYLAAVFISVLASMMFTYFDRYVFCQNFRYVLPMLVPFTILYAKGMETLRDGSLILRPLYLLGCVFGIGLPLVSTVLFLSE